jgi:hypothetical protein
VSYKVVVRAGPRFERAKRDSLEEALDYLELKARELRRERAGAVDVLGKRYEPEQRVVARIEVKGPAAKGGIDIHGDGSIAAWTGGFVRRPLDADEPLDALRQRLSVGP